MRFTKMHGLGNDYVYVNAFVEEVPHPEEIAVSISDRHRGVGGDGLILIRPPSAPSAHCRMEMYNADGSRAEMCGNGIRCVGKYVFDHGIAPHTRLHIETDAGMKTLTVIPGGDGKAEELEVDMGPPILPREAVPFSDGGDPRTPAIDVSLSLGERDVRLTAVSMGNPHAVVRLDHSETSWPEAAAPLAEFPLETWGRRFEHHAAFPEGVNTEFIKIPSRTEIEMRVWERGSGETLACGTGAAAAAVAAILNGWCEREVVVHLAGGDLRIRWLEGAAEKPTSGSVFMTGPAVEVFSGEFPAP